MDEKENTYNESHGTGLWGTMIFMAVAIVTMMLLRYFLNY